MPNQQMQIETPNHNGLFGTRDPSHRELAGRALVVTGVVAGVLLGLLLVGYAYWVFFLLFAAVLEAVFLRGLTDWVSERTGLSPNWSLGVVVLTLLILLGGAGYLLALPLASQADRLLAALPGSSERIYNSLGRYHWLKALLDRAPPLDQMMSSEAPSLTQATGYATAVVNAVVYLVLVVFVGIFLAANPDLYVGGVVRLFPLSARPRGKEVIEAVGYKLGWWLVGRMILMALMGVMVGVGLWLLNVPLALILAVLTGLLNFVPTFGPLIACVPSILIALTVSPELAISTAVLYVGVSMVDGYLFTPLIQQRTVKLAPAVLIFWQVLLGAVAGPLGLALATPVMVALQVLVQMVFRKEVLGDPTAPKDVRPPEARQAQSL